MNTVNTKRFKFLLIIILVIGTLLRFIYLDRDNLWRDEAFSVNAASASITTLIHTIVNDVHPPLHLLLLHIVIKIFGNGEIAVRLLSSIFGIGILINTYLFSVKHLKRQSQILLSILLIALNPVLVLQSREARPYPLFVFFFSVALYYFFKIIQRNKHNDYLFFIIAIVLMCYTHYIGLIILLVMTGFIFLYKKLSIKYYIVLGIGLIPLMILFAYQYLDIVNIHPWLEFNPILDIFKNLYWMLVGTTNKTPLFIKSSQVFLITTIAVMGSSLIRQYKTLHKLKLLLYFTGAILILMWLVSFKTPIFYIRYLSFLILPFSILLAYSIKFFTYTKSKLIFWCILSTTLIIAIYSLINTNIPKYTDAISFIGETPVRHISPESFHSFQYYKKDSFILGDISNYNYYQGTAVLTKSNFVKIPNVDKFYLVKLYLPRNSITGHTKTIQTLGYKLINTKLFKGIILELWEKT